MSTVKEKKIDGVPVRVSIIPKGNPKVRPGYAMRATSITVHTTGNKAKSANAENHRRYLHRMSTDPFSPYAGYHFVVDDKEIIQLLPISIDGAVGESGWHSGDGSGSKSGNRTSIGIEICENVDGDFDKAENNAKKLIRYLMERCEIPHKNVFPHKHWSGKDCPKPILNRKGGWEAFHESILETSLKTSTKSASKTTSINLQSYTVQKGDTLWDISQEFNTTVAKIKKDNNLKDDLIHPGDELMVKSKEQEEKKIVNEYEGKRVESLLDGLRFYNQPSWEDKDVMGTADKGFGFDILDKIKVDNGYQYKVQNSKGNIYYITANEKYVKVI
jgi:N-acetylmuramoyl-L-alanine amidase